MSHFGSNPLLDFEFEGEDDLQDEGLEFNLQPHEIIARIETCALWLANQASIGQLPDFVLSASNSGPSQTRAAPSQLPPTSITRSLIGRHAESADKFARLWAVLSTCHEILVSGGSATQRDLHYRLKTMEVFASGAHLIEAIQDAVLLLRVPRSSLGISCSSKGLVSGALLLRNEISGEITDCSHAATPGGRLIPGNITAISDLSFSSTASVLLVIEKDTVFQQLSGDASIGGSGKFILVTGKGVPDVGTRAFVAAVHAAMPALLLLGLVDWNPSGVIILSLYRHGSRRMAESARYALPALRWLGARSGMLQEAHGGAFQDLTPRDRALLPGLRSQLTDLAPAWVDELDKMESAGAKADIEALYSASGGSASFGALIERCIANEDWI